MAKSAKVRRRYFVFFSEPRITDKLRSFLLLQLVSNFTPKTLATRTGTISLVLFVITVGRYKSG